MACFLVTGGAGFIGSYLVHALLGEGHTVRVLDNLSSGHRKNVPQQVELIEADVTDPTAVESALDGVDGCFHLAAIASAARSHLDWLRTHQVNLTGTINVLDQARPSRRHREVPVVYASTAAIYGNCGSFPVDEESPAAPLSAYGADKHACELHARVAGAIHGVPTIGLRFFNLYGPRQDPLSPYSGVISIFADRLLRGDAIEIFGDGEQARDFTYIGDAVRALCCAMRAASTSAVVFNVCTGKATSVRGLAEIMADLCGTELVVHRRPARCGELRISIGDPQLAAERLGFTARTMLSEGLAITLNMPGRKLKGRGAGRGVRGAECPEIGIPASGRFPFIPLRAWAASGSNLNPYLATRCGGEASLWQKPVSSYPALPSPIRRYPCSTKRISGPKSSRTAPPGNS